ncbi:hypothetical protein VaNZ11_007537 [Volvox africanus]|uniref:DUF1279 domain-containing protein n=1 Tax=Volvox africanus TaxID=51714 RepID=A0ABQ5S4D3_9CHLO|nr:hypothetical protein VaNZ11_007537 [Volvox africanus]
MDPNSELGKECLGQASLSGLKAALQASVVSGALYLAAMKYSPFFRNVFSVSARTALTVGLQHLSLTRFVAPRARRLHDERIQTPKSFQDAKPEYVSIQDDDEDTVHQRRR